MGNRFWIIYDAKESKVKSVVRKKKLICWDFLGDDWKLFNLDFTLEREQLRNNYHTIQMQSSAYVKERNTLYKQWVLCSLYNWSCVHHVPGLVFTMWPVLCSQCNWSCVHYVTGLVFPMWLVLCSPCNWSCAPHVTGLVFTMWLVLCSPCDWSCVHYVTGLVFPMCLVLCPSCDWSCVHHVTGLVFPMWLVLCSSCDWSCVHHVTGLVLAVWLVLYTVSVPVQYTVTNQIKVKNLLA